MNNRARPAKAIEELAVPVIRNFARPSEAYPYMKRAKLRGQQPLTTTNTIPWQ
jgi:hypothetical protein